MGVPAPPSPNLLLQRTVSQCNGLLLAFWLFEDGSCFAQGTVLCNTMKGRSLCPGFGEHPTGSFPSQLCHKVAMTQDQLLHLTETHVLSMGL